MATKSRMKKYKIVWKMKAGSSAGKERTDYIMAMDSVSARNKFKREIGGGKDWSFVSVTLA